MPILKMIDGFFKTKLFDGDRENGFEERFLRFFAQKMVVYK
jgi:hypothetical protein